MNDRHKVKIWSALSAVLIFFYFQNIFAQQNSFIEIDYPYENSFVEPLDDITVNSSRNGTIKVFDGDGVLYIDKPIEEQLKFTVGGALGRHIIILFDDESDILETASFLVDCKTEIIDGGGKYSRLLDLLYATMTQEWNREASVVKYKDKYYHYFVGWLRDHVHTLKGMKYFYPELKSGIDLYADSQREDGMIWDNYTHKYDPEEGSYWNQRFRYGDFVRTSKRDGRLFTRIPVENDVEYLFIEGIYYTWKASGDDIWMTDKLDNALKALNYSLNSEYRFSNKYQLLKRGYTIDTWDFQNDEDAEISAGPHNDADPMIIRPEYTRFGIMFGDNTGMAASCLYLSEMLEYAGRNDEAVRVKDIGNSIQQRTDDLCWNGKFYTHHIPEDENLIRDLGVEEAEQISLSNAYSLNRNISHEKAVKIIGMYQEIKKNMPSTSPGEFYTIYPPFGKGFGSHNSTWNYMNGGVTSIVAGELAHGAFEHGFENYGVDILQRILDLAESTNSFLHCTYRGKQPDEPSRKFKEISLNNVANTDIAGNTVEGVMGWTNEGENDLHQFPTGEQEFEGIPFSIVNPKMNNRKVCLGLSTQKGYSQKEKLTIESKAASIYLLHTASTNYYAGSVTLHFDDGETFSEEIGNGKITNWWYPNVPESRKQMPKFKIAWRGKNKFSDKVGVSIYGFNNPHPDKIIKSIEFNSSKNGSKWMLLGVTLSDYKVHFTPGIVSGGIPDNWGAAAVVYALVEGLAGIKDLSQGFKNVNISPRWAAAKENLAEVSVKYPSSNGYIKYLYHKSVNSCKIKFTGSMIYTDLNILLPRGKDVHSVEVNDKNIDYEVVYIEKSKYVHLNLEGPKIFDVEFHLN